jgi:hypothetical protein
MLGTIDGPRASCFWLSPRNFFLVDRYILFLALVGPLVGANLHGTLGLRRHSSCGRVEFKCGLVGLQSLQCVLQRGLVRLQLQRTRFVGRYILLLTLVGPLVGLNLHGVLGLRRHSS